jgi:putative transposase
MTIDPKLLDELLVDYKRPEDIIGANGLLKQLTKALLERALNAELTEHVGYDKHDPAGYNSGNSRNGATKKKLKGVWHPVFLDFARYWEFTPRLCRPYRAQTKGKLESGVKYVRYSVPR